MITARICVKSLGSAVKGTRGYATSPAPSMAILDDYLSVSQPHFNQITPSSLDIKVFKSHIPQKTDAERAALVEKLKPFSGISTMREGAQVPATLLKELPNLKLLLCSR